MNAPTTRLLYPVSEAAAQLGIGRSTLYELVRAGAIEVVRIGSRTLIPASSLERYADSLSCNTAAGDVEG